MQQVDHFWELIIGTVIALLPIINPLAAAPSFLAITEGDSRERRLQQLRHACFYMVGILVSFLIGGTFIMSFFGISIPGLRIAGGFLVAGIGSAMLLGAPRDPRPDDPAEAEARPFNRRRAAAAGGQGEDDGDGADRQDGLHGGCLNAFRCSDERAERPVARVPALAGVRAGWSVAERFVRRQGEVPAFASSQRPLAPPGASHRHCVW